MSQYSKSSLKFSISTQAFQIITLTLLMKEKKNNNTNSKQCNEDMLMKNHRVIKKKINSEEKYSFVISVNIVKLHSTSFKLTSATLLNIPTHKLCTRANRRRKVERRKKKKSQRFSSFAASDLIVPACFYEKICFRSDIK